MLRYRQGFAMSYNSDALLIAVPVPRYDFARCRISRNSGSASKTISPSQQPGALMTRASRNFNSQCGASRPTHSISQCTRTSDTTANASSNKIRHDVMSFRYPMSTQIDRERDVYSTLTEIKFPITASRNIHNVYMECLHKLSV